MKVVYARVSATTKIMKYLITSFIMLTVFAMDNTFAGKCDSFYPGLPPVDEIDTQIPFVTQTVNNGEYDDGLCFSYNLKQAAHQKIMCTFINFNDGWMLFRENNITKESSSYKGAKTIILTSKRPTKVFSDNLDQYHVDENGIVAIHHERDYNFSQNHAVASCSYIPDEA